MRATMSVLPPAGNGTTTVTGLTGPSAASNELDERTIAKAAMMQRVLMSGRPYDDRDARPECPGRVERDHSDVMAGSPIASSACSLAIAARHERIDAGASCRGGERCLL